MSTELAAVSLSTIAAVFLGYAAIILLSAWVGVIDVGSLSRARTIRRTTGQPLSFPPHSVFSVFTQQQS
jgi:hypothetical protein